MRRWLPSEALQDSKMRYLIAEPLLSWSERWLGGRSNFTSIARLAGGTGQSAGVIEIDISEQARERLLHDMLATETLPSNPDEGDRRVLDAFWQAVVADLKASLEAAFPATEFAERAETIEADAWIAGSVAITVRVPAQRAIARRMGRAAASEDRSSLANPMSAVAEVGFTMEARMPAGKLAIDQLARLTAGDVVVLDVPLDTAIHLSMPGGSLVGQARVEPGASGMCLRIVEA